MYLSALQLVGFSLALICLGILIGAGIGHYSSQTDKENQP